MNTQMKAEIAALKDEAAAAGVSELALWIDKQLKNNHIPALNLLAERLAAHTADHPDMREELSHTSSILNDKLDTKAAKEELIVADDATDLSTALILLNDIKSKLNSMNS
jgi:hypothetical protein